MINKCIPELRKGLFLIASPSIDYGIFYRSVVLLCHHSSIGSFGLIINKPIHPDSNEQSLVPEQFLTQPNIRSGGPNQPNRVVIIQNQQCKEGTSLEICKEVYLNKHLNSTQENHASLQTLVCFGYGGWDLGVLERELLNGIWFLCPATKEHVFDTSPSALWRTLLKEMGGKYKTLSLMPENLDLN